MTARKRMLLAATASAALLAIPPTGAMAFDDVDWEWDKYVDEYVDIDITIQDDFNTTGMVEVEKLQMHFGDIEANATIYGVDNNAVGEDGGGDGLIVIDEIHDAALDYTDSEGGNTAINPIEGPNTLAGRTGSQLTVELYDGDDPGNYGNVNQSGENIDFVLRITGEIPFEELGGVKEAIDLPKVENTATAVANNQQIESTVPVYLHDAQIAAGDFNGDDFFIDPFVVEDYAASLNYALDFDGEGGNTHTTIAALTLLGAATGFINPAEITADATIFDANNTMVDNAATAVTNNMSVELAALTPNDAVVIADITQVGVADVYADATLTSCGECGDAAVELNGYTDFAAAGLGPLGIDGVEQVPIVSNVATAVGNNLSIKVSGPGGVVID